MIKLTPMRRLKKYTKRILIAIDQLINTVLGPWLNLLLPISHTPNGCALFGLPDETLSSVFAKNAPHIGWCYVMCRFLNFFEKDHCKKSIEEDEGDYRGG